MTARHLRALMLGLVLFGPVVAPALGGAGGSAACAAGRPHAALVVDTGPTTTTYCVGLTATSVTGLHLIQLAAAQYGLQYRLGFGGQAVCQLNGVGVTGGNCFGDYPDYWGYWHGNGSGGWTWAGSGAGSSTIRDGDVDGWSWGSGDSGTTHPRPPRVRLSDVCTTTSPSPAPTATRTPAPTRPPSPSAISPTPSHGPSPRVTRSPSARPSHPPVRSSSPPVPASSASPIIVRAIATSGSTPSSGGPPTGAIAAVAVVLVLGVAGWIRLRRHEGGAP